MSVSVDERRHEPLHGRRGRVVPWVLRSLPLTAVLLAVAVLYGTNLGGYPAFVNDDEGTYYAQAWAVLTQGRLTHYSYWYDHPPLGWIQLAAGLPLGRRLSGDAPVLVGGRAVMAAVMVVSAALLHRVAGNLGLPRAARLVVVLVWCLSPLTVFLGRQVLLDSVALAWLLASVAAATGPGDRRRHVLSGLCFGIAVLSKETALLAGPGILVALCTVGGGRPRRRAVTDWLAAAGLVPGCYLLVTALAGDAPALLGAVAWQLGGREGSGSVLDAGSVAHGVLASWLAHDPYLLLVGTAVAPLALLSRTGRGIALIPLVLVAAGLRPGGYLPAMHAILVLPFLALVVVHTAWRAWRTVRDRGHAPAPLPRPAATAARAAPAVLVALVAAAVVVVAPPWARGARAALTQDHNAPYRQALAFVATRVPRDTVVLTDDTTWNDLVRLGWSGDGWEGPLWHYKLDRDPDAAAHLPDGWRDVDYVLAGRGMGSLLGTDAISWQQSPQVLSAWQNSTVVRAWGPADAQVVLRRVDPDGTDGCVRWTCPAHEPTW
ncbi:ArnT family glycosyltransferase [Cellulomonas shaoxiangyii]|uniref:Glycosyltransferase RgtA/B/C/D-like domain-containing protein n=1 Tax=Cellulomonas shaoxiangyii TaxID=2566013 RepID=A0A4P7SNA2_9CELL|nr:glycosyltransferase family 39 protein [Cellulomonas shaoxiangyii]QCB95017.1 hypothetical protein E5225_17055 [Cellulomonas shaoxiangyii]TGY86346.1 hypothetical protein E5226_02140 [Cellulomonas shaoxiangyii]